MSRIRTIKPDFFIDEDVAKLKPLTRILFTGLWCLADKAGRLEDRPQRIKIQILPYDNIDIDTALNDLANAAFIIRYTIDGQKLIQIRSFNKHQRPHHTEKESEFPPYNGEITVKEPLSDGDTPVGKEGKGKEGKGKERSVAQAPVVELPEKVKQETWDAYLEMRKSIRKPANLYAQRLIIKKLLKMGGDMNAILEQSIMNSWQGVFELKEGGNGTGIRSDARRWLRRPGEDLSPDAQQAIADAKQAGREALARRAANRAPKDT